MAESPRKGRLKGEELAVLQFLGASGAERDPVVLTSGEVGARLGVSQQAADRYLLALEKRGLLQRTIAHRKQRLSLTADGVDLLRKEYHVYRRIFEGPARVRFRGTVASG